MPPIKNVRNTVSSDENFPSAWRDSTDDMKRASIASMSMFSPKSIANVMKKSLTIKYSTHEAGAKHKKVE